jgi:UDP-glucose 4-epimerase
MTYDPAQLPLNFRSGHGQNVSEVIAAFEAASHQSIADTVIDRWAGDAASSVTKANQDPFRTAKPNAPHRKPTKTAGHGSAAI